MQVADVLIITATIYVDLVFVDGSCVTPSWGRDFLGAKIDFLASYVAIGICDEVAEVKNVYIVEVDVLAVTTTEGYHTISTDLRCCVESFGMECFLVQEIKLGPLWCFEVKCPDVLQVCEHWCFTAAYDHETSN
jgi:hypothetical protein